MPGASGDRLIRLFLEEVSSSTAPAVLVIDVGANDGKWGQRVLGKLLSRITRRKRRANPAARLVSVEPQPRHIAKLMPLAQRWNDSHLPRSSWEVVPAVAWTEAANLTFYLSSDTEASSLVEEQALAFSDPGPWCSGAGAASGRCIRPVRVPAIDFASSLLSALGSPGTVWPALLKLDVEASEYALLPKLLVSGALCGVSHILVEWHLNALPAERRLTGLALRLAFDSLLSHGCTNRPTPVPVVQHDEDKLNNFGERVPGLAELLQRHEPPDTAYKAARPFALAHEQSAATSGRSAPNHLNATERTHARQAKRWLQKSAPGYCASTDYADSRCEIAEKGSWPLPSHAKASWVAAAAFCSAQCATCSRCRFISISPSFGDCSWFSTCNLNALHVKPSGFRTGAGVLPLRLGSNGTSVRGA